MLNVLDLFSGTGGRDGDVQNPLRGHQVSTPRIANERQRHIEEAERQAKRLYSKATQMMERTEGPDWRVWWTVQASAGEALKNLRDARQAPGREARIIARMEGDKDHMGVPQKKTIEQKA